MHEGEKVKEEPTSETFAVEVEKKGERKAQNYAHPMFRFDDKDRGGFLCNLPQFSSS